MFKALLVASIAMLACCAAAVLAGPVQPASSIDDSPSADSAEQDASPLHVVALAQQPEPVISDMPNDDATGFVSVPLSATYDSSPSVAPEEAAGLAPAPTVQSAVIPLPSPLYAALALLGVALIARRAMLRAC